MKMQFKISGDFYNRDCENMQDCIENFFKNVTSVEVNEVECDDEKIRCEYYTCEDIIIGRAAFAFLSQENADHPNIIEDEDGEKVSLFGYTLALEFFENGDVRVATISATYQPNQENENDGALSDEDVCDICCGLDEVLRSRVKLCSCFHFKKL